MKKGIFVDKIIYEAFDQMHLIINSIKVTFFHFPHKINANINFEKAINIPSLLDLASMKVYALGGRAKLKDYVDLYFILKHRITLSMICDKAKMIFDNKLSKKLFHQQLSYFENINYFNSSLRIFNVLINRYIKNIKYNY